MAISTRNRITLFQLLLSSKRAMLFLSLNGFTSPSFRPNTRSLSPTPKDGPIVPLERNKDSEFLFKRQVHLSNLASLHSHSSEGQRSVAKRGQGKSSSFLVTGCLSGKPLTEVFVFLSGVYRSQNGNYWDVMTLEQDWINQYITWRALLQRTPKQKTRSLLWYCSMKMWGHYKNVATVWKYENRKN